ncbi:uncharacterized protein LOC127445293 [Myxocyprinus asiaticus]|uniref:uncharacterized protein LOC127445293 n=1 Tax=Myxocyprinus asiaticus TaxID=70543 RepID=UPI00222253FF|nr:uncharacterized protein LOC127445293 [Myxocyprinus asiaticus]
MERTRVIVITLVCILFFEDQKIFGTGVDIVVKPGDNITLFCDHVIPFGSYLVWIRNSSHENQSSLLIDTDYLFRQTFPHFSFVCNSSSNSFCDLHIKNISVSDQGLYYCGIMERKISNDANGIIISTDEYRYGNRRTRLSVLEPASPFDESSTITTISDHSVSITSLCWKLLFSVCPLCVLFFSIFVYCLCKKKTTGSGADCGEKAETQTETRHDEGGDEVYYTSLNMASIQQKQLKKKRLSSDFSAYSELRFKRTNF